MNKNAQVSAKRIKNRFNLKAPLNNKSEVIWGSATLIVSLIFSIKFLTFAFIDPRNYYWIFGDRLSIRDNAGHAIASLFYAHQEKISALDIGRLTTFGGDVAGSLIYFAVSPIFAIPMKLIALMSNDFYQFIGIQVLIGLVLTSFSVFLLCRRVGVSSLSSFTVAVMSLFLPTTFSRSLNESLTMQFLVVFSIFLLIQPRINNLRVFAWCSLGFLSVAINMYFLPIVLLACLIEFVVLKQNKKNQFIFSIKSLSLTILVSIFSIWWFGGFKIQPKSTGTDPIVLEALSSNFNTFLDSRGYGVTGNLSSQPSWESFNYLGIGCLSLILIFALIKFAQNVSFVKLKSSSTRTLSIRINFSYKDTAKNSFIPTILFSLICFLISLGPVFQIGKSFSFDPHYPDELVSLLSTFRALGRFSWPLLYILLVVAALGLDEIMKFLQKFGKSMISKTVLMALVAIGFLSLQANEARTLISAVQYEIVAGINSVPVIDDDLLKIFQSSERIEVVPAYDGNADGKLPWREMSLYALKAELPIETWGFFARYDAEKAGNIQSNNFSNFVGCKFPPRSIYLVTKEIYNNLDCRKKLNILLIRDSWMVTSVR
jgi:hypothetical protein